MSAKDLFHNKVIKALEKQGWKITDNPLRIKVGGVEMYIDLGAEKIIGAEKNGEKIAVEIKSFVGNSAIYEFHAAIGQFMDYRIALEEQQSERILYLAIPLEKYQTFFKLQFIQTVISRLQINLIVYNPIDEEIVEWKN